MEQPKQPNAVANYQLICGILTLMPLLYMAIIAGLKFSGILAEDGFGVIEPGRQSPITMAMIAAGISAGVVSIPLRKLFVARQSDAKDAVAARFQGTLGAMAMSESGAVMGLVLMLLTGNLIYGGLLCALSFAITCFHFPSRHWLEHGRQTR